MSGLIKKDEILEDSQQASSYQLERDRRERDERVKSLQDQKELSEFLRCVAYGEQNKAEMLLKAKPSLALMKGSVRDPSGREFKSITGFQYAVWGLDWYMWRMLLQYMDQEAAVVQWIALEEEGTDHGRVFSLQPLMDALDHYLQRYDMWVSQSDFAEMERHWCQEVGMQQFLLPVSVVNEYCHRVRPLEPVPSFREPSLVRNMYIGGSYWYTGKWQTSAPVTPVPASDWLGVKLAVCRYHRVDMPFPTESPRKVRLDNRFIQADLNALRYLGKVRQEQQEELRVELSACLVQETLQGFLPKSVLDLVLGYLR